MNELWVQMGAVEWTPIVLALVFGGLIGLERELHGRPAGLRTHTLVCLCSTLLMVTARDMVDVPQVAGATIVFDPQRLSAGIVTGIGFLGAAAVVRAGDMVRGLTTGASVWCVAGLGVVIGEGAYGYAAVMTLAALFILVVLDMLPGSVGTVVYRRLKVQGSRVDMQIVTDGVREVLRRHRMRVQEIAGQVTAGDSEPFELVFHVRGRSAMRAPEIMDAVSRLEGVAQADWVVPRR